MSKVKIHPTVNKILNSVARDVKQQSEDCFELEDWDVPTKAFREAWLRGYEYANKKNKERNNEQ